MGMREEIEALRAHVSVGGVELLPRSAVLRIIDKHAAPVVDMTPGMQPRQPSKERWDKSQPATVTPAYLCAPCNLEVEVGETFGHCPRCSKPMEMNPRFMSTKA